MAEAKGGNANLRKSKREESEKRDFLFIFSPPPLIKHRVRGEILVAKK